MKLDCVHFQLDMTSLWAKVSRNAFDPGFRSAHLKNLRDKFKEEVGFFDLPVSLTEDDIQKIVSEAQRLRRDFDSVLFIGIGGSYLGAAALMASLPSNEFPYHWVSNIDTAEIEKAQHFIQKRKVATVVISKSGNTVETLAAFYHLSQHLDPKGFVFITDPNDGELRRLSKELNAATLSVPQNVGGRFSVLSCAGLFPATVVGMDPRRLIKGAKSMRSLLEHKTADNPACLFAEALFLADTVHSKSEHYLMPYRLGLKTTAEWFVQLWGESLGKMQGKTRVGPTPIAAVGTSDQHSILQLLKDGPLNKVVGFLDVLKSSNPVKVHKPTFNVQNFDYLFRHTFDDLSHQACLATKESLDRSSVATYRIEMPSLNVEAMAGLFFFFETACAYSGELYGIDAFRQPGVEDMKAILRKSL